MTGGSGVCAFISIPMERLTAAIVSVGGIIGVGQKDVMIPFKDLMISTRNGKDWLTLNRTKDELKMLPTYDKTADANKM